MPVKLYFAVGYAALIVILGVFIRFQHLELKNCKQNGEILISQIDEIKKDAELRVKRFEQAKKISDLEAQNEKRKIETILQTKVPKDCQNAIKWGIEQANEF